MSVWLNVCIVSLNILFLVKVSGIEFRIIGGYKAPEEYGKFHASIQNLSGHHVCGGGVVSKWSVVTAAHCVLGARPQHMRIVAGTINLDVEVKRYRVQSITIYDQYNKTSRAHDIAMLKTKTEFDLSYIKILQLSGRNLDEGEELILMGFGAQKPNGLSTRKMYALELPVFNQETCEYAMRYSRPVTKEMFCTFTRVGQGTCHGDSGSPLIKGNELVGIVSWGVPCAVGFPDVHTRISPYIQWIQYNIRQAYCVVRRKRKILTG